MKKGIFLKNFIVSKIFVSSLFIISTYKFTEVKGQKQSDTTNMNGIATKYAGNSSLLYMNNNNPFALPIKTDLRVQNSINSEPAPLTITATLQADPNVFQNNPTVQLLSNNSTSQQSTNGDVLNNQQYFSSIYGGEDPIIYLDYSSFNDEILRKKTASFVYFNANFDHCRNCHKFFSTWKELALDILYWRQVVKLFAINCSDEDNIEVCRRAGVTQFPQVKFYWIMSNNLDQDGYRIRILGKSVHAMRHLIMDKILENYNQQVKLSANQKKQQLDGTQQSSNSNNILSLLGPIITNGSDGITNFLHNMFDVNNKQSTGNLGSQTNPNLLNILSTTPQSNKVSSSVMSNNNNIMNTNGANSANVKGLNQMMNLMLGVSTNKIVQKIPSNWPKLESIDATDSQQLINSLPIDEVKNVGALLIMETQEFLYTGLEVMLDLNPYTNQTYIARIRDERSLLSKNLTKRDDIQAPALIYIAPNKETKLLMTSPKYTNDEDLRRLFVRAFERKQIKYPVKRYRSIVQQSNDNEKINNPKLSEDDEQIVNKIHSVYMNDLTNTIRASLMEQVFRHSDLSDDQYNALVKYIYILINYFPFNDDDSLKFLKRLHTWLQNQVSPMDVNEYKKQFHDVDDVFKQKEWIACKSLSNTKTISMKSKKSNFLFDNPSQIGKVVSNITRLFRTQQQQVNKLKNFFNAFTTNMSPVMLNKKSNYHQLNNISYSTTTAQPAQMNNNNHNQNNALISNHNSDSNSNEWDSHTNDSPIERIMKSLTSGSLGSDSSILKLISTALTGGARGNGKNEATGKSKFAREYPCGAWKLAHVMVVSEFIKDSPRKDVKHIVLHSLYQYMLHFYSCSTCGNRVSDVNSEFRLNIDDHLQDQSDSIMLLWKIHNRISKRLEGEMRPGSLPKIQFPTESLCPKCRPQLQRSQISSDLLSTSNWHEKQVLNFLIHHYRPQSILTNTNTTYKTLSSSTSDSFLKIQIFLSTLLSIVLTSILLIRFDPTIIIQK